MQLPASWPHVSAPAELIKMLAMAEPSKIAFMMIPSQQLLFANAKGCSGDFRKSGNCFRVPFSLTPPAERNG
jgi:hypothetical protein